MATRRGPRFKECRRFGINVCGHPKALDRLGTTVKRSKKMSEYGKQLLEKQKIKAYYGIFERQLHFQCGFVYVSSENADFTSSSMGFHVGVSHIDSISIFFQGEAKRKGTGE